MKALEKLAKKDKTNTVTKKDGTLKLQAYMALLHVGNERKFHHSHWTRSGKHINLHSYYSEVTSVLRLLGYKWIEGNDAPRGGKEGDFIKISPRALKTIQELRS